MWVFLKNLNGASFYWKSPSLNLGVSIAFQVTTIGHPTWPKADRRVMNIIRNNRFHFSVGCPQRGETYRLASKGNENCTVAYLLCSPLVNYLFNQDCIAIYSSGVYSVKGTMRKNIHLEMNQSTWYYLPLFNCIRRTLQTWCTKRCSSRRLYSWVRRRPYPGTEARICRI